MTIDDTIAPPEIEFAISMRGYDRDQVDEYLDVQRMFLDEAHERMHAAEAALAAEREQALELSGLSGLSASERALVGLSDHVADAVREVLAGAEATARALLDEAGAAHQGALLRVSQIDAEATERAQAILRQAEAAAGHLRVDAQQRADRTIAEAQEEVEELRQQADVQAARRDEVLAQIIALRTALEGAVPVSTPAGAEDPTTVMDVRDGWPHE